jgi:hypothetical protein
LSVGYVANTIYTLSADITSSQPISLSFLGTGNAGIALTDGSGTVVSSTTTAPAGAITISPIDSDTSRVTLQFTTGGTPPTGNIGIELLA